MKEKFYFVMPAYNEAENIESVVRDWYPVIEEINREHEAYLMIANDGSKDNTYEIMKNLKKEYPYFIPIDKANSGHGATLLFLYHKAIEEGADYIFQTDSDGQTNPREFWTFYNQRHEYDFQIGTRGGREDGFSRIVVTRVLRLVVWLMFHVWVKDANTPFRLMSSICLKEILAVVPKDFFLSNVAISAIAVRWNKKIAWYPITFRPRQGGVNSINMKRIFKIGLNAIRDFYKINRNI